MWALDSLLKLQGSHDASNVVQAVFALLWKQNLATAPTSARPTLRILLIEAEEAVAVALQRSFRRLGWDVAWSRTAKAGLRCKAEFKPQVVLLALGLPDMNSRVLITQLTRQQDCGVIVISGQGEGVRHSTLNSGAHAYLQKPLTIREIMTCVQALQQQLTLSDVLDDSWVP